jgi:glutaminyl-peptide cyclotransferase
MTHSLSPSRIVTLLWLYTISITVFVSAYKPLSDSFLRAIPSPGADFDIKTGALLAPIIDFFTRELPKWTIEWQNSTSTTPTSSTPLPFGNLIFKREPPWVKPGQANLLTLVAHYDSKIQPPGFIGATDSAAPCAMLMHAARSIDKYVSQMHDEMKDLGEGGTVEMDMGVQIVLLDGEEAFQSWTDTDSLYGSRYGDSNAPASAPCVDRGCVTDLTWQ